MRRLTPSPTFEAHKVERTRAVFGHFERFDLRRAPRAGRARFARSARFGAHHDLFLALSVRDLPRTQRDGGVFRAAGKLERSGSQRPENHHRIARTHAQRLPRLGRASPVPLFRHARRSSPRRAGVRPAAPGFARVAVEPRPGHLRWLEATLPHPRGQIKVNWRAGELDVQLPDGVTLS